MEPPLVIYPTEEDYRRHYERFYCTAPVVTFDGISVRFSKGRFVHCFYESSKRNSIKDRFSRVRAERIDWIKATLQDPKAELYQGWDKGKSRYDPTWRVSVVYDSYVVVLQIRKEKDGISRAEFKTAYVADNSIDKIRKGPEWTPKK
ncbi:MAG: hypothetical protein LAO21_21135 [Acidobacteriia bacterium]|nr:hypothetical protein [Terriglobia bacterium]